MSVTVPPPTPVPAQGYWPMPPPGTLPGCGPPSNSLMDCYWSVQSATAFISAIMIDAINNNPAVAQAIISAIEESGSTLPLIGVTNGTDAQPGQVGEFVHFTSASLTIPTAANSQTVNFGVLQPGDWDCWAYTSQLASVHDIGIGLTVQPPGFSNPMFAFAGSATGEIVTVVAPMARALLAVPTLVAMNLITNQAGAGSAASSATLMFSARRRR